jgi:hypothetical protein
VWEREREGSEGREEGEEEWMGFLGEEEAEDRPELDPPLGGEEEEGKESPGELAILFMGEGGGSSGMAAGRWVDWWEAPRAEE